MSIPSESLLRQALMRLIGKRPGFSVVTEDAHHLLKPMFPQLTPEEAEAPYTSNRTRFGNALQVAVNGLRDEGWLEKPNVSGAGTWRLSSYGQANWNRAFPDPDDLLADLTAGAS